MRTAFKEWAVVVDALGRGDQILILRKGGIHEREPFKPQHESFLLFPTQFHQQRESVIPSAQAAFDELQQSQPPVGRVRIQFFAETVFERRLEAFSDVAALRGQHIWRDDVLEKRFEWGKGRQIHALAVRVFRLAQPSELPLVPAYGGCKSWVELEHEASVAGAEQVLPEKLFQAKLAQMHTALDRSAVALA